MGTIVKFPSEKLATLEVAIDQSSGMYAPESFQAEVVSGVNAALERGIEALQGCLQALEKISRSAAESDLTLNIEFELTRGELLLASLELVRIAHLIRRS